jgi:hypothetical protein
MTGQKFRRAEEDYNLKGCYPYLLLGRERDTAPWEVITGAHTRKDADHLLREFQDGNPDWEFDVYEDTEYDRPGCSIKASNSRRTANPSWWDKDDHHADPDQMIRVQDVLDEFDELLAIQTSSGNWDYNPYMHGMANGMILMRTIISGEEPDYLDAPEHWREDEHIAGMQDGVRLANTVMAELLLRPSQLHVAQDDAEEKLEPEGASHKFTLSEDQIDILSKLVMLGVAILMKQGGIETRDQAKQFDFTALLQQVPQFLRIVATDRNTMRTEIQAILRFGPQVYITRYIQQLRGVL